MALKSRRQATADSHAGLPGHYFVPGCQCLTDFFREELLKHQQCLERQREYYSDTAITQAEDAITRIVGQLEILCQRDDACQMMGELLRKFDLVTKLSAWTEADKLH
jgi:hypothetical protein